MQLLQLDYEACLRNMPACKVAAGVQYVMTTGTNLLQHLYLLNCFHGLQLCKQELCLSFRFLIFLSNTVLLAGHLTSLVQTTYG